jgi:hypothetical protein
LGNPFGDNLPGDIICGRAWGKKRKLLPLIKISGKMFAGVTVRKTGR